MRRLIELTSLRPGNEKVSKEVGQDVFDKLAELAMAYIFSGTKGELNIARSLLQGSPAAEVLTILKERKHAKEQSELGLA